jgi:putative transport protein
MVTSGAVEGRTLSSLAITDEFGCWLTKFSRAGVDLPLEPELRIQIGDTLLLTGVRPMLESLAENLGHVERRVHETDLVTFAFGIALGILLGTFSVTLVGVSIGLGTAGGVLISGLTFGLLRSYRPTFGRVPSAARYVLMELGLLMFMAHVGLTAGGTIVATFSAVGPTLMLSGMVVTLVPVFVAFAVGRLAFKMNPALLLGAITGAMTSTAALKTVTALSRSEAPTFGYVGSYTFANIFLAVAGGVIMRL